MIHTWRHRSRRMIGLAVCALTLVFALLAVGRSWASPTVSGTSVGGPIISDTTWTLANSPYLVTSNIQVMTGVTLTIQPGVVVRFNSSKLLQVDGALVARGLSTSPITFTSNQPSPRPGDWANIYFTDGSMDAAFDGAGNYANGSVLQYSILEYAGKEVESAIHAPSSAPFVDHCMIRNNASRGLRIAGTSGKLAKVSNNVVSGNLLVNGINGGGILANSAVIVGNTVTGNAASRGFSRGGGIYALGSTVVSNTVSGNDVAGDGGGIYAESSTASDNTVSSNSGGSGAGIYARYSNVTSNMVSGNVADLDGGGVYCESYIHGTATVASNTFADNLAGMNGGGLYAVGETVTVIGNLLRRNYADRNGGGIYAAVNAVTDNTVTSNSSGWSGGGAFIAGSTSTTGNAIFANRVVRTGNGSGVYLNGGTFLFNTVVGNTADSSTAIIGGIAIEFPATFQYNTIYGNSNYDVAILRSDDISGTNNFWGTSSTVDILAHVYDWYDDTSRGRLLYLPYLQDPDPNTPVAPPHNLRVTANGTSLNLSWDALPSTTMGYGYKVYYGYAADPPFDGTGATQGPAPIDIGNQTHYTLAGLGNDRVYMAVTAYDTLGHESWYSNVVSSPMREFLPLILRP